MAIHSLGKVEVNIVSVFNHDYLHKVCFHIFKTLGATETEANVVSTHVVKANLVGHDSHGVIQVPVYAGTVSGKAI